MPIAEQPQLNRQHPVPQNIMDVEFKLIGDLTMRQFAYLLVFGISAYLAHSLVFGIFKWPTVVFLSLLGLGFAFVPVEERGLDEWVASFIKAIRLPTQRVWKKEPTVPTAFLYDSINVVHQEMITLAPTSSRRKLEHYLDRQKAQEELDPLDIPEREYILKVREAFQPEYQPEPDVSPVSVSVIDDFSQQDTEHSEEYVPEEQPRKEFPSQKQDQDIPRERETLKKEPKEGLKTSYEVSRIKKAPPKPRETLVVRKPRSVSYEFESITPEAHAGRKFVNLLPSQGELILPIRGEKVIKTSEQVEVEDDVNEKAERLQQLLQRIRKEEKLPKVEAVREAEVKTDNVSYKNKAKVKDSSMAKEEVQDVVSHLKDQNVKLNQEIEDLKKQINQNKLESKETSRQEELLKRLESEKERIASSYGELSKRVQDLQKELGSKTTSSTGEEAIRRQKSKVQVLTNKVNVVSGVVRDSSGRNLEDILLIIKNKNNEAIRAFKTNSIGQFVLSTPLDDGVYTVEVSPANKINLTFDIIPIEVKGGIIPPVEMVGR